MAEDPFDVLVIGGGITGAGIAHDAAARGLSVALVEKDDFAAGTSGRSSRLVHGGLRYLEHREFGLVRESLRERGILFRLAPHLIRPVPMYMLAGDLRSRATYRAGLAAYELLAAGRNVGYHRSVGAGPLSATIPGIGGLGQPGGRAHGFRYFECQVDDARLTIEVARTAQAHGALLANHARVTELLGDGRVTGAVRTTAALVAPSEAGDGRFIFIVPWEDRVYAGTTDTPYAGDLDRPAADAADREYILSAVARNFPGVTERDVVASWAGLRPLLSQDEELGDARTSDLSRNHAIFTDPFGLFTITGGKLTTYRAMAHAGHPARAARAGRGGRAAGPGRGGPPRPAAADGRPAGAALRRRLAR